MSNTRYEACLLSWDIEAAGTKASMFLEAVKATHQRQFNRVTRGQAKQADGNNRQ